MRVTTGIVFLVFSFSALFAQSFYTLTGVKSYDPMVINMTKSVDKKYDVEIQTLLQELSQRLKIDTSKHDSRVLVVLLRDFSVGETVGLKVSLQLGEYVTRANAKEKVFALTYTDTQMFNPKDLEEELVDTIDDMLEKFASQYEDDNEKVSQSKKILSHEDFATNMGYEKEYAIALAKAQKANKPLFVFMTTNYCPWCRKLEKRVLAKADIHMKIKEKYVPLMLNFDTKKFPKELQKNALTPTLYIINSKTEKVEKAYIGYMSKDEFLYHLNSK